jgi:hypothetical protein
MDKVELIYFARFFAATNGDQLSDLSIGEYSSEPTTALKMFLSAMQNNVT